MTAIGGTEFAPDYSGGDDVGSVSETVWNDGDGAAGGGESKVLQEARVPGKGLFKKDKNARRSRHLVRRESLRRRDSSSAAATSTAYRAVECCIGGTSVGAPAWAGISQLISQSNGAPIGNLNTRIYQLGAKANGAMTGIRDVTSGNTSFNGVPGFSATTGYDKASGWGTVDMGVFVPAYLGP